MANESSVIVNKGTAINLLDLGIKPGNKRAAVMGSKILAEVTIEGETVVLECSPVFTCDPAALSPGLQARLAKVGDAKVTKQAARK